MEKIKIKKINKIQIISLYGNTVEGIYIAYIEICKSLIFQLYIINMIIKYNLKS
nr:MAG TPA: hypothetical protein [Bacteriophage sp.]